MASAKLAVRSVSDRKSAQTQPKQAPPEPALTVVRSFDPGPVIVREGDGSEAIASGPNAVAVAIGRNSRSVVDASADSGLAYSAAIGTYSTAETSGEGAFAVVSVGVNSKAISKVKHVPSVAVGHESCAVAEQEEGMAISIGDYPAAEGEDGSWLVFIDTSDSRPEVGIFRVEPNKGLLANTPYAWRAGWESPAPDLDRIEHDAYERGLKDGRAAKHKSGEKA